MHSYYRHCLQMKCFPYAFSFSRFSFQESCSVVLKQYHILYTHLWLKKGRERESFCCGSAFGSADIQFHSTFLLADLVGSIFLFISFVHEISLKYKLHQTKVSTIYCLAQEHRFHFLEKHKRDSCIHAIKIPEPFMFFHRVLRSYNLVKSLYFIHKSNLQIGQCYFIHLCY